jgi:hypothetical protein
MASRRRCCPRPALEAYGTEATNSLNREPSQGVVRMMDSASSPPSNRTDRKINRTGQQIMPFRSPLPVLHHPPESRPSHPRFLGFRPVGPCEGGRRNHRVLCGLVQMLAPSQPNRTRRSNRRRHRPEQRELYNNISHALFVLRRTSYCRCWIETSDRISCNRAFRC